MNRLLIVTALATVLSGCVVGGEAARHDMEVSLATYKACLAARGPEACGGQQQSYAAYHAMALPNSHGSRDPIDFGFGDENAHSAFHYIGPFSWGGGLTPAAEAARAAHQAARQRLTQFFNSVQQNFIQTGNIQTAFTAALKANPGALATAQSLGINPVQLLHLARRQPRPVVPDGADTFMEVGGGTPQ